jgi:hypothetical protein
MSLNEIGLFWQDIYYAVKKILCCSLEASIMKVPLYHTSMLSPLQKSEINFVAEILLQFIVCRGISVYPDPMLPLFLWRL